MSHDDATGWALAARDGDQVAAAAFVRATQTEVWRFVGVLVDTAHADDLTQETYLRAFRALPSYEGRASARTWLFGIAKRACADHLRRTVRQRRLAERLTGQAASGSGSPAGGAGRAGGAAGAGSAAGAGGDPAGAYGAAQLVRSLPEPRRTAFVLTQLFGWSYAEAAEAEGCPIGTIRSRVARARDELIEAVQDARSA